MVRFGIKEGKNVIVDATNLNPKHEYRLRRLAEELGVDFIINDEFLKVPPEECIERDLHRGAEAVGSKVIWDMYDKWVRPQPEVVLEENSEKRRVIVVDLDGALVNRTVDRSGYDTTLIKEESTNPLVSFLLDCIKGSGEYYCDVILVTSRSEESREKTENWLKNNCLDYKELLMREINDNRKDYEVKEEILVERILPYYAVLGVIDNNTRRCSMYYERGIDVLKTGNPKQD